MKDVQYVKLPAALQMRSYYNIRCRSVITLKYDLFFIVILECIDASVPFWHEFKKLHYGKK